MVDEKNKVTKNSLSNYITDLIEKIKEEEKKLEYVLNSQILAIKNKIEYFKIIPSDLKEKITNWKTW